MMQTACQSAEKNQDKEIVEPTEAVIQETTVGDTALDNDHVMIDMKYLSIQLSNDLAQHCRHMEVSEGSETMDVFYMLLERGEMELFRVYFGNHNIADPIGFLDTNEGTLPVAVAVCTYNTEDFITEEEFSIYNDLMGELNTIIDAICALDGFKTQNLVEKVAEDVTVQMRYWSVNIPDSLEVEEVVGEKIYKANFYCMVAGEKTWLYSIYLGNAEADTQLGTYRIGDEERDVWVKTYDLVPQEGWTAEDVSHTYEMMATINDIIGTITSNENFSEVSPE
jgi:hypothetical protein